MIQPRNVSLLPVALLISFRLFVTTDAFLPTRTFLPNQLRSKDCESDRVCLFSATEETVPVAPTAVSAAAAAAGVVATARGSTTPTVSVETPTTVTAGSADETNSDSSNSNEGQRGTHKGGTKFRNFMIGLSKKIRNKRKRAYFMDRELRVLEQRWYEPEVVPEETGIFKGPLVCPDTSCYAMVIDAYSKSGLGKKGSFLANRVMERFLSRTEMSDIRQTTVLYTSLIKAWANADDLRKAKYVLHQLEDLYLESRNPELEPDQHTYSEYLNALSRSKSMTNKDIAEGALKMLKHMDHMATAKGIVKATPNSFSFGAIIRCVGRLGDYTAVDEVFNTLKERYHEATTTEAKANLKPTFKVYGAVLNAYSRGNQNITAALAADQLLSEMKELYEKTSDPALKPNEYIYSSILTTYSRVRTTEEAVIASQRADELVKEYENDPTLQISPHVYASGTL